MTIFVARNSRGKIGDLFKGRRLQVYVYIHNYGKRTIPDRARQLQQLSGKKYRQGHPASESFQTRQKRLKWISLCFRSLFHKFGAALKTIYPCGCLRGTLAVSNVLGGSFVSSESFSILTSLVETARTRSGHTFIRKS